MEVEVYADLLFLINAGMDGLCLTVTARLLHRRVRVGRWLAGTALGGVYAVLSLFLNTEQAVALGVDILVCLLLCAVVFGWRDGRGLRGLLAAAAVFTALSMLLGGVMTALFNLCNRLGLSDRLPGGGEGIGAWLFLVSGVVGSVIGLRGGRLCRRARSVRLCEVTVTVDGASLSVRGLVDSGNLLRDPAGGRAVICLSPGVADGILSPALRAVMASGGTDVSDLREVSDIRRLRLIPAGTATGGRILPGFRPDKVVLTPEGGRGREADAVIAVMASPVAAGDGLDGVDALVPAELL